MDYENIMDKKFGKSALTRRVLEELPHPICSAGLTDIQMEELADCVDNEVIEKYPEVSYAMFQIWRKEHQTDEDRNFLFDRCRNASKLWWILVEEYAIEKIGAKYIDTLLTF
jgi:hypothetical protein